MMDEAVEDPHYERTLRMVLWGEKREDVYHMLSVNGVTGERADAIYTAAFRERVGVIHSECRRKSAIGLGFIILSIAIFCGLWFGMGFIPRILIGATGAGFLWGSWKFIDGFAGMMMAAKKEGPVTE